MIIFCKNCKHFKSKDGIFWVFKEDNAERCKHKSNIRTDINHDSYKYSFNQDPNYINKDNNCSNFEGTLTYKFKRFFFKSKED